MVREAQRPRTPWRRWCHQPVDRLSMSARFQWLQRQRGTVCHHRPRPPPHCWYSSRRPSLTFFRESYGWKKSGAVPGFLLIDSKLSLQVVKYNHSRSGVVYNFGRVCLSAYLSVCLTFESLDIESSYLHKWLISRKYESSSYMKVIGSRSRSQEQKGRKSPFPHSDRQ